MKRLRIKFASTAIIDAPTLDECRKIWNKLNLKRYKTTKNTHYEIDYDEVLYVTDENLNELNTNILDPYYVQEEL